MRGQKSKQLYLLSQHFKNFNSCGPDKVIWQQFWSKLFISRQVWKTAILEWGKASCFTPKIRTYEEIEADISIFLGYSVLCKALAWFCSILIFNLQFVYSFF